VKKRERGDERKKEMEQPMAPWCWYQPSEKKKAMDE